MGSEAPRFRSPRHPEHQAREQFLAVAPKSNTTRAPEQEAPAPEQPQSFRFYNRVQLAGRLVADPHTTASRLVRAARDKGYLKEHSLRGFGRDS